MNQCLSHLAKDLRQGLSSCFTFLNSSSEILSAMALLLRKGMKMFENVLSMFQRSISVLVALMRPARMSLWKVSSPRVLLVLALRKYMQYPVRVCSSPSVMNSFFLAEII